MLTRLCTLRICLHTGICQFTASDNRIPFFHLIIYFQTRFYIISTRSLPGFCGPGRWPALTRPPSCPADWLPDWSRIFPRCPRSIIHIFLHALPEAGWFKFWTVGILTGKVGWRKAIAATPLFSQSWLWKPASLSWIWCNVLSIEQ